MLSLKYAYHDLGLLIDDIELDHYPSQYTQNRAQLRGYIDSMLLTAHGLTDNLFSTPL